MIIIKPMSYIFFDLFLVIVTIFVDLSLRDKIIGQKSLSMSNKLFDWRLQERIHAVRYKNL